jgi:hypothetical protein
MHVHVSFAKSYMSTHTHTHTCTYLHIMTTVYMSCKRICITFVYCATYINELAQCFFYFHIYQGSEWYGRRESSKKSDWRANSFPRHSLGVYVCVCVYACIRTCMHTYICIYTDEELHEVPFLSRSLSRARWLSLSLSLYTYEELHEVLGSSLPLLSLWYIVHIHTHTHMHTYMRTYTRAYAYTYTHTCIRTYTHIKVCHCSVCDTSYTYTHAYIHTCVHIIHIHTRTHAHTHTHIHSLPLLNLWCIIHIHTHKHTCIHTYIICTPLSV